ncbi:MAG: DnaJ domain-containing protein [Acidobacteriia bacterium]|nr:DnaJ domain-containing protein [Terriglobia bacterium]
MIALFALYVALVVAVIAKVLRSEYRHMRSPGTAGQGLRISFGGSGSSSNQRIQSALSGWAQERAETDLGQVRPLIFEPPEVEQEWKGVAAGPAPGPPVPDPAVPPVQEFREPSRAAEGVELPSTNQGPDVVGERFEMDTKPQCADYYEVLQISRAADPETIYRVYRIMASRFHPDNTETGDVEKFLALREAYQVLSEPALRAEYDRGLIARETGALAAFSQKEFVEGLEGEMNRRLGVLSLLYNRRRMNEDNPGISVLDLERLMSFPREYLQFTLWYLKSKGYVTAEDNSDYGLTPAGVDYLEDQSARNQLIRELLTGGARAEAAPQLSAVPSTDSAPAREARKSRAARRARRALAYRADPAA